MRKEIEKYINENIHLIKKIDFYNTYVIISMFDGTNIDIIANGESIEIDKY